MLKVSEKWKKVEGKYKCPYCDKVYTKKGISTHNNINIEIITKEKIKELEKNIFN